MGTYDYKCRDCGNKFEHTAVKIDDLPYCPNCRSSNLTKLFSICRGIVGMESPHPAGELYMRPDRPPNPARMWKRFARVCEEQESEGKIPHVDDGVELSIKAWEQAGYTT
jgi:putative FmdB family regulatory protein